jgi:hypothetical protein
MNTKKNSNGKSLLGYCCFWCVVGVVGVGVVFIGGRVVSAGWNKSNIKVGSYFMKIKSVVFSQSQIMYCFYPKKKSLFNQTRSKGPHVGIK